LAPSTLAAIKDAELLVGGERHLSFFPGHPADAVVLKGGLEPALARIRQARAAGRRVVVLASGDPGFFGIGAAMAHRLGRSAVRVLPAASSVALAFARLGEPWHDAVVLSAHGRPLDGILGPACTATKLAVLCDPENTPAAIARALLECGMENAEAAVGEHLGSERERVVRGRLATVAEEEFAALSVLVVLRQLDDVRWGRPLLGLPDDCYRHERGMITKPEVRAVTLSKLRPADASTVWDIGAGSGSVAIECASHMLRGRVYAVERDPVQVQHLRANVRAFQAGNVRIVEGAAPRALETLPSPDAVFIGGTGGAATDMLSAVAPRLRPAGRVVLNLVTIEHMAEALAWCQASAWEVEVTQVSVSRSSTVGARTRLAALNPVFVVSGRANA
jgi:precorrin-6Y C5,15-methyltransferase (decarboxylating)